MAEALKVCKIIRPRGDTCDLLTRMPEKELVAEIEQGAATRDRVWARFECVNSKDERVPVALFREDIRGYFIMPFHPAEQHQDNVRPRVIQ